MIWPMPISPASTTTHTFHLHKMNYSSHRGLYSSHMRTPWYLQVYINVSFYRMPNPIPLLLAKFIRSATFVHANSGNQALCCVADAGWSDGYPPLAAPRWHSTLSCPPSCPGIVTHLHLSDKKEALSSGFWLDFSRGRRQQKIYRARKSKVTISRAPALRLPGWHWLTTSA